MKHVNIGKLPRRIVRIGEINLRDRRFQVRATRASDADASDVNPRKPVLWIPEAPYTLVRGFRHLDGRLAIAQDTGSDDLQGTCIEAAFLLGPDWVPSLVDAMFVACTGEPAEPFRLTTRDHACAIRRLREWGVSDEGVSELLRRLKVPQRTAERARRIAGLPEDIRGPLEAGTITVATAEMLLRRRSPEAADRTSEGRPPEASTVLEILEQQGAAAKAASETVRQPGRQEAPPWTSEDGPRTSSRRPRWEWTPEELIRRIDGVGAGSDPSAIRALIDDLDELKKVLRGWLGEESVPP